jgi:hypothetical protein
MKFIICVFTWPLFLSGCMFPKGFGKDHVFASKAFLDQKGHEYRYDKYINDKAYREAEDKEWMEADKRIREGGFKGIGHPYGDEMLRAYNIKPRFKHKYSRVGSDAEWGVGSERGR